MKTRSRPTLRVRTGCLTCRTRKKKCDEQKPRCRGCTRNHFDCLWPGEKTISFANRSERNQSVDESTQDRQTTEGSGHSSDEVATGIEVISPSDTTILTKPQQPNYLAIGHEILQNLPTEGEDLELDTISSFPGTLNLLLGGQGTADGFQSSQSMAISPSLFPGFDPECFEVLSYYVSRTANSMGNGSTETNPFLTQLIPLAFSSQLILRLILTQSAAQRAIDGPQSVRKVAQDYYVQALGLFRAAVNDVTSGLSSDNLLLTAGSLILCYVETAKGDTNGAIFDHLTAARSVISSLMNTMNASLPPSLTEFLVEYYIYTMSTSMMSVDARFSTKIPIESSLEQKAYDMVRCGYVGQLSGCWLEVLLIIPRIFEYGRTALNKENGSEAGFSAPNSVIRFSELHHEILSFTPRSPVSAETLAAGYVYQNAVLLYLYTVLLATGIDTSGDCRRKVDAIIEAAMSQLSQIPLRSRMNTSLCWPLAIIGSCTDNLGVQCSIRERLQTMSHVIGLGNMRDTLTLLEHVWIIPLEQRSPWTLCCTMQDCGLWISLS